VQAFEFGLARALGCRTRLLPEPLAFFGIERLAASPFFFEFLPFEFARALGGGVRLLHEAFALCGFLRVTSQALFLETQALGFVGPARGLLGLAHQPLAFGGAFRFEAALLLLEPAALFLVRALCLGCGLTGRALGGRDLLDLLPSACFGGAACVGLGGPALRNLRLAALTCLGAFGLAADPGVLSSGRLTQP
jgi:hypothetical protein